LSDVSYVQPSAEKRKNPGLHSVHFVPVMVSLHGQTPVSEHCDKLLPTELQSHGVQP